MADQMKTPIAQISLADFYLFDGLDEAQLASISASTRRVHLQNGEHLFEQMQPAERFYVLECGQITLKRFSSEGDEKIIEIIYPGQSFAEAVMFLGKPLYPVTAVSVGESYVLGFSTREFLNILRESNQACLKLMAAMSIRLRRLVNEIDHLTMQSAISRIANYLLYQVPADATMPFCLELSTPKNMIASFLSIKPETLSRTLHDLSQQGVISVERKNVCVHDLKALRRLSGTLPEAWDNS